MKICESCGTELNKYQKKYCSMCEALIRRERDRKRRHKRKSEASGEDFVVWEAPICFNCTKPECTNCLSMMGVAKKKALLAKIENEKGGLTP